MSTMHATWDTLYDEGDSLFLLHKLTEFKLTVNNCVESLFDSTSHRALKICIHL